MRFLKKLRALASRQQMHRDLDDELRFHLEMKAEALGQRAGARRTFGNPTLTQEVLREMWTFSSLESWWRDIRYAIRSLAAAPGFTSVAIIALALGIGADTAMFTILTGAFTWNMGLDHPDRIVIINTTNTAEHRNEWGSSYPDFRDYRARVKSLEGVAAYQFVPSNVSDQTGLPERFWNAQMSANGFRVAEVKPALGRDFADTDERPEAPPVLMLSHRVWQERYGRDPAILGKVVRVDEVARVVIGVMPPDRRFPEETDLWTPLAASEKRDDRRLMMFGRVPENDALTQVRAELRTIGSALAAQYPGANKDLSADVRPIAEITGVYAMRPVLAALFAAVGFVLLIACADVANMLLARGAGRTREMSIRLAIGAGKSRILRQLLVESVVLAVAGGLLGWLIAVAGLRWFESSTTTLDRPVWLHLSLDRTALLYMTGVSIGTGILFGLAPAWRLAQTSVNSVLKDGGHGTVGGRVSMRLSSALVVFQMILCVVLLSASGLMIRSASRLTSEPTGVTTANILTARINLPQAKYALPESRIEFHRTAKSHLEALPGVVAAAATSRNPVGGWDESECQLQSETGNERVNSIITTSGYFPLFDLKPLLGRTYVDDEPAIVINQAFAAKYWPNEAPIGKRLRLMKDHVPQEWLTVVGVVPNVLQDFRARLNRVPLMYVPYAQLPDNQMTLVARTQVPPATLARAVRTEIQKIDQNLPLFQIRSLDSLIAQGRLEVTMLGSMCTVFAVVALLLATVGLYSVIAHSVNMRSQEIGLRMAMGGTRRDILKLVFAQGMRPLFVGMLIGIPLALAAMSGLRGSLVGVAPTDPVTFASVILVLVTAGVLGCVIPARRATRVDPVVALRCQ